MTHVEMIEKYSERYFSPETFTLDLTKYGIDKHQAIDKLKQYYKYVAIEAISTKMIDRTSEDLSILLEAFVAYLFKSPYEVIELALALDASLMREAA